MRISHFFIDRPIFAAVVSIFITIVGAVAYFALSFSLSMLVRRLQKKIQIIR